jgi:hypothetical protein
LAFAHRAPAILDDCETKMIVLGSATIRSPKSNHVVTSSLNPR